MAENSDDLFDALDDWLNGQLADKVNTMLEGTIEGYSAGRVDVRPLGDKTYSDGDSNAYGVIYDLPLHWPSSDGGKAGFKVPIKLGDKCMIFFKQHPQEAQNIPRRFSMADAYVVPGTTYPDDLGGNDTVRMFYNNAYFEITADGIINANCKQFNVTASESSTFTTPKGTFSGELISMGLLTYNAGMSGNGGSGVTATINGKVIITDGTSTIGGKPFLTHHHSGVTTGSGQTGNVV